MKKLLFLSLLVANSVFAMEIPESNQVNIIDLPNNAIFEIVNQAIDKLNCEQSIESLKKYSLICKKFKAAIEQHKKQINNVLVEKNRLSIQFRRIVNQNNGIDNISYFADIVDLVKNGANINTKSILGATALHDAAKQKNIDLAKLLIEHGADVNVECEGYPINYFNIQ